MDAFVAREPYLNLWQQGMGTIETVFVNQVDFWMSFGLGTTVAIAVIGFYQIVQSVRSARANTGEEGEPKRSFATPAGRGDFPSGWRWHYTSWPRPA